jgi:hypothetical protein
MQSLTEIEVKLMDCINFYDRFLITNRLNKQARKRVHAFLTEPIYIFIEVNRRSEGRNLTMLMESMDLFLEQFGLLFNLMDEPAFT